MNMTRADEPIIQALSPLTLASAMPSSIFLAASAAASAGAASSARATPTHSKRAIASKGEDRMRTISGSPYEWGSEACRPRAATHGRVQGSAQVGGGKANPAPPPPASAIDVVNQ